MHKHIKINLSNSDGNAFAILGKVKKQAIKQGLSIDDWEVFQKQATQKDYHYLLMSILKYFDVIFGESM